MDTATSHSHSGNAVNFVTVLAAASTTSLTGFAAAILRGALILAFVSALVIAARPAQGQVMNVIYNFPNNSIDDGAGPSTGRT